jgi:hypothetical protein
LIPLTPTLSRREREKRECLSRRERGSKEAIYTEYLSPIPKISEVKFPAPIL